MKRTVLAIIIFITITACSITASAETLESTSYLGNDWLEYIDDSYDVRDNDGLIFATFSHDYSAWNVYLSDKKNEVVLEFVNGLYDDDFRNSKMKVPDRFITKKRKRGTNHVTLNVIAIESACAFKAFDLNPESKYMKLVDNVVFSKDGKTLMSYAQFDDRTVYEVPDGTKNIAYGALYDSENLVKVIISDSVTELSECCFWSCGNLKEVVFSENSKLKSIGNRVFNFSQVTELTLPSFEIQISNTAFGICQKDIENLKLKSHVKPRAIVEKLQDLYILNWNKIPNAAKYEVYQKKGDGSYKLLKETAETSIQLNGIRKGKEYLLP